MVNRTTNTNQSVPDRSLDLFQLTWAVSSLVLMACTWKLWIGTDQFPQIPLLSALIGSTRLIDWGALAACCFAVVVIVIASTIAISAGKAPSKQVFHEPIDPKVRIAAVVWSATLALLFATSQHRLQPWAWQCFLLAIVTAVSSRKSDCLSGYRAIIVPIYLWSAIGKFDYQFLHGLGRRLVATLTELCNYPIPMESISPAVVMVLPIFEFLIGLLLIFRMTRFAGLIGVAMFHLGLVAVLGPWGMNHHTAVVVWNIGFGPMTLILFWTRTRPGEGLNVLHRPTNLFAPSKLPAIIIVALTVILPGHARTDHWLAWGLYAPNNRRCTLITVVNSQRDFEEAFQPFLVPLGRHNVDGLELLTVDGLELLQVDMGRMSLHALNAPIYPEARVQVGVAQWIVDRFNLGSRTIIKVESKSDPRTGLRTARTIDHRSSEWIDREFFFNHRPRFSKKTDQ